MFELGKLSSFENYENSTELEPKERNLAKKIVIKIFIYQAQKRCFNCKFSQEQQAEQLSARQ